MELTIPTTAKHVAHNPTETWIHEFLERTHSASKVHACMHAYRTGLCETALGKYHISLLLPLVRVTHAISFLGIIFTVHIKRCSICN